MKVIETNNEGEIYLEILTSDEPEKQIGAKYWVVEKNFKLVNPANQVKEL